MNESIHKLRSLIEKYTPVSDNDWQQIKADFQVQAFSKDELILEEGKVCKYFYFFEKGLVRFCCNVDGEDVTKNFGLAPYCFTSKVSFRNQSPAKESIQALEDTVVWRISYTQYQKLEKIESWNIFMRKLIGEIQEYVENRMLEAKIYTAEKNYENLLKRYPADLMQRIPLKYLASFLGVAPQSLSRIRNKLQNSKS